MTIEFDRIHTSYFDTDNQIHPLPQYHIDRLWRGGSIWRSSEASPPRGLLRARENHAHPLSPIDTTRPTHGPS
jgi:hypothetical protein